MRVNFVLLAKGAALDISADVGGQARPPEFSRDQLASLQEARMTGGFVIMAALEDGAAEGIIHGDIDTAFVREDAGLNLPVSEPRAEWERNVLVHGLEGLENKGVSCGCGFNAVGEGGVDQVDKEGRWKKGDISVVGIVRGEEIRAAGEGIRTSKEFAGDMDHL